MIDSHTFVDALAQVIADADMRVWPAAGEEETVTGVIPYGGTGVLVTMSGGQVVHLLVESILAAAATGPASKGG